MAPGKTPQGLPHGLSWGTSAIAGLPQLVMPAIAGLPLSKVNPVTFWPILNMGEARGGAAPVGHVCLRGAASVQSESSGPAPNA
jgi:hypothetical protein